MISWSRGPASSTGVSVTVCGSDQFEVVKVRLPVGLIVKPPLASFTSRTVTLRAGCVFSVTV